MIKVFDPSKIQPMPQRHLLVELLNRPGWANLIKVRRAGDRYVAAFAYDSPACLVIDVDEDTQVFELWHCTPVQAAEFIDSGKTSKEVEAATGKAVPEATAFADTASRWLASADPGHAYREQIEFSDEDYGL